MSTYLNFSDEFEIELNEPYLVFKAFSIVNEEWEYSHRKGFKCTFEHGTLHLYFNFTVTGVEIPQEAGKNWIDWTAVS